MAGMNRKQFFDSIRAPLFSGELSAEQVNHLDAILDASAAAGWPLVWAAYGLATAHHETGRFRWLKELGGADYFRRMYDITGARPALARANGNIHPGDGARFIGRGYVHLTWRNNYRRAGEKIGVDLERYPEMAADPAIASRVMIEGMQAGWFTSKAMRHYLNGDKPDYVNARRIINGTDKAAMIAGYARAYERALVVADYKPGSASPATVLIPPPPDIPKPETPASKPRKGLFSWLGRIFKRSA
jgi:putative chitinase